MKTIMNFPRCDEPTESAPLPASLRRVIRSFAGMALIIGAAMCGTLVAEDAPAPAPQIQSLSFEVAVIFQRGGIAMWLLAALLVAGTILAVVQFRFLSRKKQVPRDFEKDVIHWADTKGIDAGIVLCKERPSSLARVLLAALIRHGAPLAQLEAAVRNETFLARYVLLRYTLWLGWMAAFAPIVGVLGLVLNLTKHIEFDPMNADVVFETIERQLAAGSVDGLFCLAFASIATLILLAFFAFTRTRAFDFAHDIEVRGIDAVVTLDRKARQSIRLIEDIEEKIKTESMIKIPDLSIEFDDSVPGQESAIKTAVTTHAGGAVKPKDEDD